MFVSIRRVGARKQYLDAPRAWPPCLLTRRPTGPRLEQCEAWSPVSQTCSARVLGCEGQSRYDQGARSSHAGEVVCEQMAATLTNLLRRRYAAASSIPEGCHQPVSRVERVRK